VAFAIYAIPDQVSYQAVTCVPFAAFVAFISYKLSSGFVDKYALLRQARKAVLHQAVVVQASSFDQFVYSGGVPQLLKLFDTLGIDVTSTRPLTYFQAQVLERLNRRIQRLFSKPLRKRRPFSLLRQQRRCPLLNLPLRLSLFVSNVDFVSFVVFFYGIVILDFLLFGPKRRYT
jgi:hypothetical protein